MLPRTLGVWLLCCGSLAWANEPAPCPYGQMITGDTQGHCCWTGQAWSNSRGSCVGIPQCPWGFTAKGEACVLPPTSAAPVAPPAKLPAKSSAKPLPAPVTMPATAPTRHPTASSAKPASVAPPLMLLPPVEAPAPVRPAAPLAPDSELEAERPVMTRVLPQTGTLLELAPMPVRFEARRGGPFKVTVGNSSCVAPCTLSLWPGSVQAQLRSSSSSWQVNLQIPDRPSRVRISGTDKMGKILGPIVLGLGLADSILGIFTLGTMSETGYKTVGTTCLITGLVGVALGITTWVLASQREAVLEGYETPRASTGMRRWLREGKSGLKFSF